MNVRQRSTGLATLAGRHRELDLPDRFRLVADLALLCSGGPVVVVGGPRTLSITGRSTPWLVEVLLPLLVVPTDVRQLCAHLPEVPVGSVKDALHLLHVNGMLEAAVDVRGTGDPQDLYFGRYLGVTGRHANGRTAGDRVREATVRLLGPPQVVEVLRPALARAGLAEADPEATATVHVGVVEGVASTGDPVLHVDLRNMTVGPLTLPGDTPCPECARLQLPAAGPNRPAVHWQAALAAIAARELVAFVSGVFRPATLQGVLRFDPASRAVSPIPVHRLARCPRCGDPGRSATAVLGGGHTEDLALTVHLSQAVRSWMPTERAGFRIHVSPEVEELTRTSFTPARLGPATSEHRIAPELVRAAIQVGQDVSRPGLWRRIATAGNLGSPRVMVRLADEAGRSSPRFATVAPDGEVSSVTGGVVGTEALDLLVTSDHGRVASKYGGRASAYTLLDAGVCLARLSRCLGILGQAHALAPSLGISPTAAPAGESGARTLHTAGVLLAPPGTSGRTHPPAHRQNDLMPVEVPLWDAGWTLATALAALRAPPYPAAAAPGWSWERYQRAADLRRSGGITRVAHMDASPLRAVLGTLGWQAPWACAGPPIRVVVITRDVRGVDDGVHLHDAPSGSLRQWARAGLEDVLGDLVLQEEHLQGHAVVLLATDLTAWSRAAGLLGYKLALLAAGWLLDGLYLGAAENGLACSATGGFAPRETRQRLEQVTGRRVDDLVIGFVIGAYRAGTGP